MTSTSTGTAVRWRWRRGSTDRRGFTLLEALVALTLLLTFAGTLGPLLYQARAIVIGADRRILADMVLRSVLAAPLDRTGLASLAREGETAGLLWRLTAEPMAPLELPPELDALSGKDGDKAAKADWRPYRVTAEVTWAPGRTLSAETVRLGKAK